MSVNKAMDDTLAMARVVGDVIDPFTAHTLLRVVYSRNRSLVNGVDLRPSAVSNSPRVIVGGELQSAFILSLVDADYPSPSSSWRREYLDWLVWGIPVSTDASFGQEVVNYEAPHPTAGIHRLVFVLFRQRRGHVAHVAGDRKNFNTRAFAEQNSLGPPVAAVYFNCQRENGAGGEEIHVNLRSRQCLDS